MSDEVDQYKDYTSKSRLSLMKYCPKKYYHNYVLGEKDPQNFSMAVGSRFHNFAETFHKYALEVDPVNWYSFIHPSFAPYEVDMLKWFIDQEYKRLVKGGREYFLPVSTEQMYYHHGLKIRGVIDRNDRVSPGMLSYMAKDVGFTLSERTFNKIVDGVVEGRKQLIIDEYKTGKSSIQSKFTQDNIKDELTFYKIILKNLDEFKDWDIVCGCLINPQTKEINYLDFKRDATVEKKIYDLQNVKEYPPTCTENKYLKCSCCKTPEEAGLYQVNEEDIRLEVEEGVVKDCWDYNLYI
jgi:hypothetical protein